MKNRAPQEHSLQDLVTLAPALSGAGAEILVVTRDDSFLMSARKVIAPPNRVWHAISELQAADMLTAKPCSVLVFDLDLVETQLREVISHLREQFPDLAYVLAGEQEDKTQAASLIMAGDAQGFVSKQNAYKQLADVLSAGIARHHELKSEVARRSARSAKRLPLLAGAISLVTIAAIAFGAWLALHNSPNKPGVERPNAPSAADPLKTAPIAQSNAGNSVTEEELRRANEAFAAGRYVEPEHDNALKFYRSVLEREPANAKARNGIERIAGVMLARVEAALLADNPREATAALNVAKTITPDHPRIGFLDAQVARELKRSAAVQQDAMDAEQTRQQLADLLKREQEREEQAYLAEQQRLEAERQKVAEQAKAAADALASAQQTPTPETREELKARRQSELLSKPEAVNASMVARQTQPQYPDRAQREGIEGYADVRFTVSITGEVKDVVVVGAQPRGYFEEASLRAVKKWKFTPKQIDGELYEQNMIVHLAYKLGR